MKIQINTSSCISIQKLLVTCSSAASTSATQSLRDMGTLAKLNARAPFIIGISMSDKNILNLRKLSRKTPWTLEAVAKQFLKNSPTDFDKWAYNIQADISLSYAFGLPYGRLLKSWMKKTIRVRNISDR